MMKTGIGMRQMKVRELEARIRHLEERVETLAEIADSEKRPFTYLALESGLTKSRVTKIYDLMDRVRDTIKKATRCITINSKKLFMKLFLHTRTTIILLNQLFQH